MIEEVSDRLRGLIESKKRFLITTHIDPDGDALGSVFSLSIAFENSGKEVVVYLKDRVPYRYQFLPKPSLVVHGLPDGTFDAIFVLDAGNLFRVGDGYERLREMGTIVNIDHHKTNEMFGLINIVDEKASSTAELIYKIFRNLSIPINREMAINIYTGVMTDTGSFRYENTNSEAFLICEEMVRLGVNPSYVGRMVYENHPVERLRLMAMVFSTLENIINGKIAMVHVTEEMLKKANSSKEYTDGFVEQLKETGSLDVAVLLREISKNKYKVSMRSKGNVDVADICSVFGGGGHKNAAGCVIEGTLEEVRQKLKKEFLKIR
ncbi:MAG: bifunctional oligoribonuclease/PAP phosphatase NrnA [Syntrophorhabdaceae bacterium]|nr:bifunctional oligoribonuclease/PAP phosphatase NrnA [Syntrophorhabdaceae bacterium]